MKKILITLFISSISFTTNAQNIGIGTTTAPELLTVNGTTLIDAGNLNNGFFPNGRVLKFGTFGGVGIGSNKVGGPSYNGIELFTNFSRRFVIDSAGNVGINSDGLSAFKLTVNGNSYLGGLGIGTTTPDLITHKLDVNGAARVRTDFYINRDLWVDRNLDVDGTSNMFGNVTMSGNLNVTGIVAATGGITLEGKGILRSSSSAQQIVAFPSGAVGYTNAPAGYTDDVEFVLPNVFATTPRIMMAQVQNQSGTFERWTYTIHTIDLTTHRFTVRFYNASNGPSTFSATFLFIAVGGAL